MKEKAREAIHCYENDTPSVARGTARGILIGEDREHMMICIVTITIGCCLLEVWFAYIYCSLLYTIDVHENVNP